MTQQRDFYIDAAAKRVQQLDAERAAAQADLVAHKANGDYDSASEAVQRIANIDAEARNVEDLYRRYVTSQQPQYPPQLTPEEIDALPAHKMTVNHALNSINRTSKYAKDLSPNDPYVQHGMALAAQRRQRGE
jgi:hypothetical protein